MEQYQRNLSYVPICDNFLQNLLLFVIFWGEGQVRWKIEHTFHFQREKSRKAPHTPHVETGKVYCLVWSHGGHFRVQSLDVHPSVSLAGSAHAHWVFWDLTFAVGLVAGTRWGLILSGGQALSQKETASSAAPVWSSYGGRGGNLSIRRSGSLLQA